MSKKRLEEIKESVEVDIVDLVYDPTERWIKSYSLSEGDYRYLIEQAERVQELEKDIKEWEIVNESWEEINENLAEQNKRYREALEEIVYQENLKETNVFGYDHEDISSYVEEVARQALEGEK